MTEPGPAERLVATTVTLVDIPSESGNEGEILAWIDATMQGVLPLHASGDAVRFYAPPSSDRPLVVLAGHVDTVPARDNVPAVRDGDRIKGCGSADMKSGLAVMIDLAMHAGDGKVEVGFLFFGREELPIAESALMPFLEATPRLREAALAIVLEPTDNHVEVGCLGNLNATAVFRGEAAHSARPWLGRNAVHDAVAGLAGVAAFEPRDVVAGGFTYREVVNVTRIHGGHAQNVLPDEVRCHINFRYAPGRTPEDAEAELRALVPGAELEIVGNAPAGTVPADNRLLASLRDAAGADPRPKQAWTPVAEFALAGVDAVNFGPGDPALAHRPDEAVSVCALVRSREVLAAFLAGAGG